MFLGLQSLDAAVANGPRGAQLHTHGVAVRDEQTDQRTPLLGADFEGREHPCERAHHSDSFAPLFSPLPPPIVRRVVAEAEEEGDGDAQSSERREIEARPLINLCGRGWELDRVRISRIASRSATKDEGGWVEVSQYPTALQLDSQERSHGAERSRQENLPHDSRKKGARATEQHLERGWVRPDDHAALATALRQQLGSPIEIKVRNANRFAFLTFFVV